MDVVNMVKIRTNYSQTHCYKRGNVFIVL